MHIVPIEVQPPTPAKSSIDQKRLRALIDEIRTLMRDRKTDQALAAVQTLLSFLGGTP